jgi:penicillin-binding protein 1B
MAALLALALASLVVYGAMLATNLTLPKSDEHPPLLIYGAPFVLSPGLHVADLGLFDRLHRLEYRQVTAAPQAAGEYWLTDDSIDIVLHAQDESRITARAVRLMLENGTVTEVLSLPDEQPAALVSLEPQSRCA